MGNVARVRFTGMNGCTGAVMRWGFLALAPCLGLVATTAAAAEFCVGSPSELQAALNSAADPNSELFTTTIKVKQGTYHVGNTSLSGSGLSFVYAMELLGGYNSDCSARTLNPDNTVFDGDGTGMHFEPLASLLIEGIRFQNAGNTQPDFGLRISTAADNVLVQVRNNALVGVDLNADNGVDQDLDRVSGLQLKFINNRVHGFVKPVGSGWSAVNAFGAASVRIVGNTVADNDGLHGVKICNSSDVRMASNIGWNNTGDDFRVDPDCGSGNNAPGDAEFRNNLYQQITMNTVGASGNNISGSDPLFQNAGSGNYRLQNASPAINTGVVTVSTADVDLAGNPRVVGSTVDMGAYESAVNDTIPATLTVINTNDSGAGSLRQAILDANANPDFTFINFNIPGSCPQVIAPSSADLPNITYGVLMDGWTQPGSASNTATKGDNGTRCIVLSGANGRSIGLNYAGSSSTQFWVQGIAFSGFTTGAGYALKVFGGNGNLIRGNQFGGKLSSGAGSLALASSDTNIWLTGISSSTVGGDSPGHRNVIAGATDYGVLITASGIFSSANNEIVDNLFGSYAGESTPAGNGNGIKIQTSGNTVRNNTIINSSLDGIILDVPGAHDNTIQDNRIGVRDTICNVLCFGGAAGNGRMGIYLSFGPHDNLIYGNAIKNNNVGVEIGSSPGFASVRNWLLANTFYNNTAQGTFFTTYNGADNDADSAQADMANRGLNYPVITRAYGGTKKGRVEGTLASTNGSYVIDVFSSAQPDAGFPRGEAERFHKSFYSAIISGAPLGFNGSTSFSIPFTNSGSSLATRVITLTASDAVGNTSELSVPVAYQCDVIFAHGFDDTTGDKCP